MSKDVKKDYLVYKLISPKKHVYVGITKNLASRLYSHSRNGQNRFFGAHCDKNKFCFDDFEIEIYKEELTKNEASKIERHEILKYQKEGKCLNYAKRTDHGISFNVRKPNGETITVTTYKNN